MFFVECSAAHGIKWEHLFCRNWNKECYISITKPTSKFLALGSCLQIPSLCSSPDWKVSHILRLSIWYSDHLQNKAKLDLTSHSLKARWWNKEDSGSGNNSCRALTNPPTYQMLWSWHLMQSFSQSSHILRCVSSDAHYWQYLTSQSLGGNSLYLSIWVLHWSDEFNLNFNFRAMPDKKKGGNFQSGWDASSWS